MLACNYTKKPNEKPNAMILKYYFKTYCTHKKYE